MDISEQLKQPHLSASSIGQFLDCGLAFKFNRIDKLKPEFIPDSLVFGSAIHKALAAYYMEKKSGIIMSLEEIHDAYEQFWEMEAKDNEEINYAEGKNYETYIADGKNLLSAWHENLTADDFKVIAIEEGFSFIIPGIDIPIVGFIDLIQADEAGTIIITDFKTTSRAYSADDIDKNMQINIYQLALKSNGYADKEIILKLDCLIKTKKPKFEQYYTIRTELDQQRLIHKIQQVWEGIKKEVFLPNDTGWKCKYCQFKTACEKWFLEKGV
jgi:putative RecB family exonuclease